MVKCQMTASETIKYAPSATAVDGELVLGVGFPLLIAMQF